MENAERLFASPIVREIKSVRFLYKWDYLKSKQERRDSSGRNLPGQNRVEQDPSETSLNPICNLVLFFSGEHAVYNT